jgi:hypothetical protein
MHLRHIEPTEATIGAYDGADSHVAEEAEVVTEFSQPSELDPSRLSSELTRETRQYKRTVFRAMTGLAVYGVGAIALKSLVPTAVWSLIQEWSLVPEHMFISVSLTFGLVASFFVVSSGRRPRQRRRALAAQVANSSDVRTIGSLIDALLLDDPQTREIARTALTDLLPKVTEEDLGCLTPSQRAKLYRILNTPLENVPHKDIRALFSPAPDKAVALRVAILQALSLIADEHALTLVRKLAGAIPKTDGESRIRDAARDNLPALTARLDQHRISHTLLRPSAAATEYQNTLLRGDVVESEHDGRELLRGEP